MSATFTVKVRDTLLFRTLTIDSGQHKSVVLEKDCFSEFLEAR